jgi:hypothetical protein
MDDHLRESIRRSTQTETIALLKPGPRSYEKVSWRNFSHHFSCNRISELRSKLRYEVKSFRPRWPEFRWKYEAGG